MNEPQSRDQTRVLTAVYEFGPLTAERIGYAIDMRPETVQRVLEELRRGFLVRRGTGGWCAMGAWSPYEVAA